MLGSTANVPAAIINDPYAKGAMFNLLFEQAPMGIALISLDGRILNANPQLCLMLGYAEAELASRAIHDVTHPADVPDNDELYRRLVTGEPANYTLEKRYLRKDGGMAWCQQVVTLVRDPAGAPHHFIAMLTDITALLKARQELSQAHARYQAILDNVAYFLFVTDAAGTLTYVNSSCTTLVGWSADELAGDDLYAYIYPDDRSVIKQAFDQLLVNTDEGINIRCRTFHKDGHWVWVDIDALAIPAADGTYSEIAGAVRSAGNLEGEYSILGDENDQSSGRKQNIQNFASLTLSDPLTGLRNRQAADDILLSRLSSARASAFPVGCLLVDIDWFKQVSDNYGPAVADTVLKQIATLLALSCRHDDFVAHYGGDQFVIVLPNTNPAGTIICGEKLIRNIRGADWSNTPLEGKDPITISIGATCVQYGSGLAVPELMGILTSQLQQAKEAGRNRLVMNTRQITGNLQR